MSDDLSLLFQTMVLLTMSVFGRRSRKESNCKRDDCIGQSSMTTIIVLLFILCHLPRSGEFYNAASITKYCRQKLQFFFPLVTGFEPGFISPLENITVAAGRAAQFTCVVKHLGGHKVSSTHWGKNFHSI